jgi:ABC-type multidrug transport system fused ATPase/permease subunit
LSLQIRPGELVAFVGPSGAGKTTLIDLILGVLNPGSGRVEISGCTPLAAIEKWPGCIGYVPQDVVIFNGTIRENIALGFDSEFVSDVQISEALKVAHLKEFVQSLPEGLDTRVGDRGTKLSGGQRQRLGIARAMYTKPKLLVLDEATSSLDGKTESAISESISELAGNVTVILIAHRLSTVRNADQVVYINEGKIVQTGSFEEVRRKVTNFDIQAKLMGL